MFTIEQIVAMLAGTTGIRVYTTAEVAELLGCACMTVEELARAGKLAGVKFGDGGWRFPARALDELLNALALEQAKERRAPRAPSGVLQALATSGKPKRKPPALPALQAVQPR